MANCGCIGGTTGIAACPPNPCDEGNRLAGNENYRNELLLIKDKLNQNYEAGYLKLTGNVAQYRTGIPGTLSWDNPQLNNLSDP
jgi:hypothetical protein